MFKQVVWKYGIWVKINFNLHKFVFKKKRSVICVICSNNNSYKIDIVKVSVTGKRFIYKDTIQGYKRGQKIQLIYKQSSYLKHHTDVPLIWGRL